MDCFQEIMNDKILIQTLSKFLTVYGQEGLTMALQQYADSQQEYICKTRGSVSKLKICDINYLQIHIHDITVHTCHGTYHKYGSISNELASLSRYGFLKCNQSTLVSLHKIRTIRQNTIIMADHTALHMSRNYAPKIIMEFSRHNTFVKKA